MRTKPWILNLWPILYLVVALSMPAQIMLLYGHGFSETEAILNKLTIMNWLVMLGLIGCAYGIFHASSWVRFAVPGLMALVGVNNFFVGYVGTDFSMITAVLATIGFVGMNVPLAKKDLLYLFENPAHAWWRAAERKELHVPVKLDIDGSRDLRVRGETFDISSSGIFLPVSSEEYNLLKDGQSITISLTFNRLMEFRCEGRIVRHAQANGHYPAGVGIQFVGLSWSQKADLERYVRRLMLGKSTFTSTNA